MCRAVLVGALCSLWAAGAAAQELSPRSYWPAPRGTKVLISGYVYSSGDVLTDPSLPVYDVDSRLHTAVLGYLQTFTRIDPRPSPGVMQVLETLFPMVPWINHRTLG